MFATAAPPRLEHRIDPGDARAFEVRAGERVEVSDLEGTDAFNRELGGHGYGVRVLPAAEQDPPAPRPAATGRNVA